MELLEVLSKLEGTGTENGISQYEKPCARQYFLDKLYPDNGEDKFDANVGTAFHKLMELYYTGQLVNVALPLDDAADYRVDPIQEALRIFGAYTTFFPANEWNVVEMERYFPANQAEQKLIMEVLGVPLTGRIDGVVELDETQATQFEERTGLELSPGLYLVDHKTKKKHDQNHAWKFQLSLQFSAYQIVAEALYPDKQMKGLIVNAPVRNKDLLKLTATGKPHNFLRQLVEPPSEMRRVAVRQQLKWKHEYLQSNQCNLDACVRWAPCRHYLTGNCNQV